MPRKVILGVGNLLLSDEGLGIHALEHLRRSQALPAEIELLDGGTMGLDLLHYLQEVSHLLIIDAVDAGKEPGAIVRMDQEAVPAHFRPKMSPHEVGLPDLLFASKLIDLYPANVVVWGMQPARLSVGLELSPQVETNMKHLVDGILREVSDWGEAQSEPPPPHPG